MDKKTFLAKLRRTLWWQLPPHEAAEVLADYNEFFENGLSEGKTEAELCAQFGDPRAIAQAVTEERGSRYYAVAVLSITVCAGLLLLAVVIYFNPAWFTSSVLAPFLLDGAIFALSVLSVCFAAKLNTGSPCRRMACTVVGWLHLVPAVMVGLLLWMMFNLIPFSDFVFSRSKPERFINALWSYVTVAVLSIVALWLYNLLRTAAYSRWLLALIPLNALLLSLVAGLMQLLNMQAIADRLPELIGYAVCKSLLQLIPLLLVPFVGRGRRHG